jgi:hypothetical protein
VNGDSGIIQFDENDDASIFSFFKFPLLKISKSDMKRIAAEKGFWIYLKKHGSVRSLGTINHAEFAVLVKLQLKN